MLSEDKKIWGKSILPVPVKSESATFSYERKSTDTNWNASDKAKLEKIMPNAQGGLFDSFEGKAYLKLLEKIPYTFRLTFKDLTDSTYTYPILDWEIGSLYHKYDNEEEALEKVKFKLEKQIFSKRNEVFLVLGSIHHRYKNINSLAIDGFIYPKLQLQPSLFGDEDA